MAEMALENFVVTSRQICAYVILFSQRGRSPKTQVIDGASYVPVCVDWLQPFKDYAIDLEFQRIYRVGLRDDDAVLELPDYEFHEPSFAPALRLALEQLLDGDDLLALSIRADVVH